MRFCSIHLLWPLGLLTFGAGLQGLEVDVSIDSGQAKLTWPSVMDRQYQVYGTSDLATPRANWDEVGSWFVGDDGNLEIEDNLNTQRFYVVEEREVFAIEVESVGYGAVGDTWTYTIIDSREDDVPFTATYTVEGTQEFPANSGQQVLRVVATSEDHPSVNDWSQTLYLLNDFSTGLYQVGGINPGSGADTDYNTGEFTITSTAKWPLLFNDFSPGVSIDADYTHSFFGSIDNLIAHELTSYTLPGDSEPSSAIEVTSLFTAQVTVVFPIDVLSITVDTYVDGVGLVHKSIDVIPSGLFAPAPISVTVTLDSYTKAP